MIQRLSKLRRSRLYRSGGFTLIELLVVITILGILAAVVVFAVSGINDRGQESATKIDARILMTAEEAYCAQHSEYATEAELVSAGLLNAESTLHNVATTPWGTCGTGDKAGFVLGYGVPNGGEGASVDNITIPIRAATNPNPTAIPNGPMAPQPVAMSKGPGYVINSYMFDSLLWRDATGAVTPWLAQSWSHPTPTTWVFTLRSGVKWHDFATSNQFLDGNDVAFTFTYFKTGAGNTNRGLFKPYLADIQSVTAAGNDVTFTLSSENNAFIPNVAQVMPILPEHIWSGVAANASSKNDAAAFVGTGPFKVPSTFTSWAANGTNTLVANDDFFLGRPYVRQISMLGGLGATTELAQLLAGNVDVGSPDTEAISDTALASVAALPHITAKSTSFRGIHFNLSAGFPYNQIPFRQAVAYALDRQKMVVDNLSGHGVVGSMGGLAPTHPMLAPGLPTYAYNVGTAGSLLDSINLRFDPANVTSPDYREACSDAACTTSSPFAVTLWSGDQSLAAPVDQAAAFLRAVGLNVTHTQQPQATFDSNLQNGNYQMAAPAYANLGNDPDWLRTRFDNNSAPTSNFFNVLGWNNATFHSLALQQKAEPNPATREAQVQQMQQLIAAEVPIIPFYTPDAFTYFNPKFTAWYFTPGGLAVGPPTVYNKAVWATGKQF